MKEKLIEELISLFKGRAKGLPSWEIINDIAVMAKKEPTFENTQFATKIYYVFNDLFSSIKEVSREYIDINRQNKIITLKQITIYPNKVGVDMEDIQIDLKGDPSWDLFKDKTLEELNKDRKVYSTPKYHNYLKYGYSLEEQLNSKLIKEKYEGLYLPIIEKEILRTTFENFIKNQYFSKLTRHSNDINEDSEEALVKNKNLKFELHNRLNEYDFFTLELIKNLKKSSEDKIIEHLISNDIPYQIAMLNFIGFIDHLRLNFTTSTNNLYKVLGSILNTSERNIKGNYLVLNPNSKENRTRYTSHLYKDKVKRDYQKIN